MSKGAYAYSVTDRHEIQRLRLLLSALEARKKSTALLIELAAAPNGFQLVVTAPREVSETALCEAIGNRVHELAAGALNFARSTQELQQLALVDAETIEGKAK